MSAFRTDRGGSTYAVRLNAAIGWSFAALLLFASSSQGGEPALAETRAATTTAAPPNAGALSMNEALSKPALLALGQTLFFDARLSRDGSTSCSTCHVPARYFSDGLATSRGVAGAVGSRNAPSLLNVALIDSQFWDGRVQTLEQQAMLPMVNPREMAMPSLQAVVDAVRRAGDYGPLFARAFGIRDGSGIRLDMIATALAAYERSLDVKDSPFDRAAFGDRSGALSRPAERGRQLFTGAAKCSSCHFVGHDGATFTDNQFHSLSIGLQPLADRLASLTLSVAELRRQGRSPDEIVLANSEFAALGRFVVTLAPTDLGAFRTPSLRNVAMTAPYMHDGSVATLSEAVDDEVYYRSNESGHPLLLTPTERGDLVAFLESLTSPLDQVLAKAPPSARSLTAVEAVSR